MKRYTGTVIVLNEDGETIFERELTSDEIIDEILKGSNKGSSEEEVEEPEETPRRKYTKKKKGKRGGKRPCKICGEFGHNKRTCPENPDRSVLLTRPEEREISDEEAASDKTTQRDDIELRVKQGMEPKEIAAELGVGLGTVYSIKSRMKRRGDLVEIERHDPEDLSDLKDPEELPPPAPASDDSEDDPMTEEEEKDLAEDIRRLWVDERKNPFAVCNELFISLKRFKYLITKYQIKKS